MADVVLWQSETDELLVNEQIPLTYKIGCCWLVVTDCFEFNESRTAAVLFVGDRAEAERLATGWAEFIKTTCTDQDDGEEDEGDEDEEDGEDQEGLNPSVDMVELIDQFVALQAS